MARLTKEDKIFHAQSDLRALQEAEMIKKDRSRLSAARKMAEASMAAVKKSRATTRKRKR